MMKRLLLLFLIGASASAQTSFKDVDIQAASGNEFETLLTNVEYGYNDSTVQACLGKLDMMYSGFSNAKTDHKTFSTYRFERSSKTGNQAFIFVKFSLSKNPKLSLPLTTKMELWGDVNTVIKFYCTYWSRELDFNNVKVGEVVSTRFLTDVATLSFPDAKTAKITVVTAKAR